MGSIPSARAAGFRGARSRGCGVVAAALLALPACSKQSPDETAAVTPGTLSSCEPEPDSGVPPPAVPALSFELIDLPDVDDATDFAFLPGSDPCAGFDLLVTSLTGQVHHVRVLDDQATLLGSATLPVFRDEGCGLHSIRLDPRFADNAQLYLTRCVDTLTSTLTRHTFDENAVLAAGEASVLTVSTPTDPPEDWHRFGSFGFEPDGQTLWVLLGDHFFRQSAQDTTTPFGSLLRLALEPAGAPTAYVGAAGNAFDAPPIYAYGLRSPWRGTRDQQGRFFVGDVGEYRREEVNLITHAGQNFGWPTFEGPCTEACEFDNPLVSYGRTREERYVQEDPEAAPGTARSVWVGDVYEAPRRDRYHGLFDSKVPFGDFYTGWVRVLAVDASGQLTEDRHVGHVASVTSWHTGPDGYMYALTLSGGLYRARQIVSP